MDQRVLIGGNKQTNIRKITEKKKEENERKKGNATRRRSNKMISLIESQLNKIISASKGAKKVMLWKVILFLSASSFSAWSGTNIYSYCETL